MDREVRYAVRGMLGSEYLPRPNPWSDFDAIAFVALKADPAPRVARAFNSLIRRAWSAQVRSIACPAKLSSVTVVFIQSKCSARAVSHFTTALDN